jgi:hypothetical protein
VVLSHAFVAGFDSEARGRADELSRLLRSGMAMSELIRQGDVFYAGHHWPPLSERELAARLGAEPARIVAALRVGVDGEPVESSYGLHVVEVEAVRESEPEAAQVSTDRARRILERERAEQALTAELSRLRSRYGLPSGETS